MASENVHEYTVGEFKGNYPDVPIPDGVLSALKELDANPFFVTLPIIPEVGAISKNGLLYDEALVNSVESQINTNRPGGIFGHLKDADRNTAFPIPEGMWVGAKREGNALWAKAYVSSGPGRDYLKRLKAVGGKIATSIYGKGDYQETATKGVRRLTSFNLESLDFAPPERAALGYGAAPGITAEFEQEIIVDKQQIIAELTVGDIPATLRAAIVAEAQATNTQQTRVSELTSKVAELETQVNDRDAIIAELRVAEFDRKVDNKVAALTDWKVSEGGKAKLDSFRRTVKSRLVAEMGTERDLTSLDAVAETVWADLQPIAETIRDALSGPPAIVNGKVAQKSSDAWRDELAAKAGELRTAAGI